MVETPRFLQGVYRFEGRGLESPCQLEPHIAYKVPSDRRAQFIYGRIGNPNEELIYLLLLRDGKPMRYFPAGAQAAMNIPLFVIEDILPDSELEILIGAPEGLQGKVLVDFGLVEI
jgi:hypothetical protein